MPSPFHLLAKPTGAACNLDCDYCFFLSKEELYPGSDFRMREDVLEAYIRQLLDAQPGPETLVAWQGGEPTLMGVEFFERSVALVERYRRPHQRVSYSIQTNGTRLDDAWCAFFKKHGFLVGISIDGPKAMHDAYRVNKGGGGSFDAVMHGWDRLRAHEVDVNILCTVHAANGDHPLEAYRFFRDELGAAFMQFIPIVERATDETLTQVNRGWGSVRLKPDATERNVRLKPDATGGNVRLKPDATGGNVRLKPDATERNVRLKPDATRGNVRLKPDATGGNVQLKPDATGGNVVASGFSRTNEMLQGDARPLYTQAGRRVSDRSVRPAQFGRFLCAIFDAWVRRDVGTVFVQAFDVALGSWLGQHNLCTVSPTCGHALALEHNGDLYACDHYVEPRYLLGNILTAELSSLVESEPQRAFGQDKYASLPRHCRNCEVLFACYGECPRNRFVDAPGGEPGLNYLCEGYKAFYTHINEPMNVMATLLQQGRPAEEVMQWVAARDRSRAGRNDPCPCGSGKKFKRCHGQPGR